MTLWCYLMYSFILLWYLLRQANFSNVVEEKPSSQFQRKCESLGCYLSHKHTLERGYCYHCIKQRDSCFIAKTLGWDPAHSSVPRIEVTVATGENLDYIQRHTNKFLFYYRPSDRVSRLPLEARECRRHKTRGEEYIRLDYTLVYSHRVSRDHYKHAKGQQIQMKLLYGFAPDAMDRFSWNTSDNVDKNYNTLAPTLSHEYQYGYMKWSKEVDSAKFKSAEDRIGAVLPRSAYGLHRHKIDLFEISAPPSFPHTTGWQRIIARSTCLRVSCSYRGSQPISPDTTVTAKHIVMKLKEVRNLLIELYSKDQVKLKTQWNAIRKKVATNVEDKLEGRILSDSAFAIQDTTQKWKGVTENCLTVAKKWLQELSIATPTSARPDANKKKIEEFDKILFGAVPKAAAESKPITVEVLPKLGKLPEGV